MPVQVKIFSGGDFSEKKINQWLSEVSQGTDFTLEHTHLDAQQGSPSRMVLAIFYRAERVVCEHPCPLCGGEMAKRFRRSDGQPFWGCLKFPECRGVVNMDGSVGRVRSEKEDGNIPF